MNVVRSIALPVAAVAALAATACKSSPCSPPSCMAEQPEAQEPACAPAPAPSARYAPSVAARPTTVPAPIVVAPKPDPEMQARIDVLRTSVEAQQRQNAEIEAKIAQAEAALKVKEVAFAPAAGRGGDEAARRLADELKGVPGAQVLVEGSSAVVVVTDSFDPGSDRLKNNPDLRSGLKAVAMAMSRHPEARVSVTGHTDSAPIKVSKWPDNTALSQARAEAVAKVLAAEGVARGRMAVKGVGPANPMVSPERTASDRAKNRRVEIEFAFGR